MNTTQNHLNQEDIKQSFYRHIMAYLAVMLLLTIVNITSSPDRIWVIWPALGWGIGVAIQGIGALLHRPHRPNLR